MDDIPDITITVPSDAKKQPDERVWRSGCLHVNKNMVKYISGYAMCLLVIIFCSYQLTRLHTCESQQLYSGIISLIIGGFLRGALSN